MAALVFLLKYLKYRFFIRDLSIEFYAGAIAFVFVLLGIWVGARITTRKSSLTPASETVPSITSTGQPFFPDERNLLSTGISKREYEVLELMSKGNSNAEIAATLFVSVNTVKTHASSLFLKLNVKRRTQAIQKAKELRLIN